MTNTQTNLQRLINELGGLYPRTLTPGQVSTEALRMIACPFEAAEDPEALEIEGCPSETQCNACKRHWLGMEAD